MLGYLSPRQVDLVKGALFMIELVLNNFSLLGGVGTENDLHVSVEECHAVTAYRVVMVSLYFLQFISQVLIIEDDSLSITNDSKCTSFFYVNLAIKVTITARISS